MNKLAAQEYEPGVNWIKYNKKLECSEQCPNLNLGKIKSCANWHYKNREPNDKNVYEIKLHKPGKIIFFIIFL